MFFRWDLSSFSVKKPSVQYSKGHGCGQSSLCSSMCSSSHVEDGNNSGLTTRLFNWVGEWETVEEGGGGDLREDFNSTSEKSDSLGLEVALEVLKRGVDLLAAQLVEVAVVEGIERGFWVGK